jgi:hypothetical protein
MDEREALMKLSLEEKMEYSKKVIKRRSKSSAWIKWPWRGQAVRIVQQWSGYSGKHARNLE